MFVIIDELHLVICDCVRMCAFIVELSCWCIKVYAVIEEENKKLLIEERNE